MLVTHDDATTFHFARSHNCQNQEIGCQMTVSGKFLRVHFTHSHDWMLHRYHFNAIVELALPGLSVASLRHVIEALSLQAADGYHPVNQAREDMRLAMIALSAHSAKTSDGHYAGDQFQLAGIPGHHVDRSKFRV